MRSACTRSHFQSSPRTGSDLIDVRRYSAKPRRKRTVKLPLAEVLRGHWPTVLLAAGALPVIHVTYFRNTFALSWATKTLGYAPGTFLGMFALLQRKRTGYRASELSTAERADLAESDDGEGGAETNPEAGASRGWRPV
ncbi:protein of unknown function [Burkholderia multivorans]